MIIVDVRTKKEYQQGHLKDVLHINYLEIGQKLPLLVPNKEEVIGLYCASGGRCEVARQILLEKGYRQVKNLGGYQDVKKLYPFIEN